MSNRRILCIWFPHLAIEYVQRHNPDLVKAPLAISENNRNTLIVTHMSAQAYAEGVRGGMSVSDARGICPTLITHPANSKKYVAFLGILRRWSEQFSPWITTEGEDALLLDISGCAHLFGGEPALSQQITRDCATFGLTCRIGIADTPGAAWAVAHFARDDPSAGRSGDDIDQEARATRSRAQRHRHWERGGPRPDPDMADVPVPRIVPSGHIRNALGPLPAAALRLPHESILILAQMGLRRIDDLATVPRAALANRFGIEVVHRLDQAFGSEAEPISPIRPAQVFAIRLTLPEPVSMEDDVMAGVDRLLSALCDRLIRLERKVRHLRFTMVRLDHSHYTLGIRLAMPTQDPDQIRPLIAQRLTGVDAGYGIEMLRLEADKTEPAVSDERNGHLDAAAEEQARLQASGGTEMGALINRLGIRLDLSNVTRLHPGDSHIPERSGLVVSAAFSTSAQHWKKPDLLRPPQLFRPEPVTAQDRSHPPQQFQWRRRRYKSAFTDGPERFCPEWWMDDPLWRDGTRDYWKVETVDGLRLWLFSTANISGQVSWFAHGSFSGHAPVINT